MNFVAVQLIQDIVKIFHLGDVFRSDDLRPAVECFLYLAAAAFAHVVQDEVKRAGSWMLDPGCWIICSPSPVPRTSHPHNIIQPLQKGKPMPLKHRQVIFLVGEVSELDKDGLLLCLSDQLIKEEVQAFYF